ncbi:MAG: hypothetical protein FJ290_06570 [Planctomycetes bacterium]|nr:hypothetical protein [Planctomycetota bacterium]
MSVREAILMSCLVVLGVVNYRERSADNRSRLAALLRREEAIAREVAALHHRGRALRREADALAHDRYYVERVARADLGWRPSPFRDPGIAPPLEPPTAIVQAPPPVFPQPVAPAPRPPAPSPAPAPTPAPVLPAPRPDPAIVQQAIAALGYESAEHFQSKMMGGRSLGQLDTPTLARAQQLNALLRQLGYNSVKSFQQRNRLTADGIMGRRTEQRALDLLRRRAPRRSRGYLADSGR